MNRKDLTVRLYTIPRARLGNIASGLAISSLGVVTIASIAIASVDL